MANFAVVGQSVFRKDANQKVTGQVLHVGNIEMPGMLHVAVLRSPFVHEQHRPAKAFADLAHVKSGQQSNICYHFKLRAGDVDKAFAEADRVFEDTFSSPPAQHMPMEPHVTLVYLDEGQRINIWTASQTPSYVRTEIAYTFGVPMNRIRVRIPYLGIDSYCVYTNHVPAGAFRGFGVPQVIWAYDSQTDMIARAIGADPVEFRLQHALNEGEAFATGTPVKSFGVKQAVREAANAIEWSQPKLKQSGAKLRGKGIAAGVKAVLTPSISGAIVIMNADGTVNVLSSTVEMG